MHSIGIFFFTGRKYVNLVVIFNNRKTCVSIKCLTLFRPWKLITVNLTSFTRCKMHITPVLLKNYSFHIFFKQIKLCLGLFLFKKIFFPSKNVYVMFMLCHGTYLNSTSNVFVYLLITFLGYDRFGFFLNKRGCIRSTP